MTTVLSLTNINGKNMTHGENETTLARMVNSLK
jgi:hypothetical protein